ncbi:MAG: DUF4365 domain-containing protein [Candidatus Competibacterales bacterium]
MSPNDKKERFSLAYIQAIAAHAGFDVAEPKLDRESIDGTLISHTGRRPRIDFQVKATARPLMRSDQLAFPLSLKNYNDLRSDCLVPRILIIVLVPENEMQWLLHNQEEELILRHCGYWLSLANAKATDNNTTVTVHIPRSQIFDGHSLARLMHNANEGNPL